MQSGDARERWIYKSNPEGYTELDEVECPDCHRTWFAEDLGKLDDDLVLFTKYCPECGSKMRIESED